MVEGTVYNSVSRTPVPFAVVQLGETPISTLANADGRYRLSAPPGVWEIEARKIGYRMTSVTVSVSADASGFDVFLSPLPVELDPLSVTARADDPGTRIMRRAIARKNDVLSRIHDYRYDAYTKLVVRNTAKDEDSTESVFLITETQTTAYWEQPDRYQEVITARRQSTNLDAENNLVSVGQIVNFNRDRIDLQKYSVVSPTADDALEHYRFQVLDTLDVDGRRVFRLGIEPGTDAAPLFVGMIDVADSTYDVLAIDVGANEAIRFEFFENLRYRQRLAEVGDGYWMPEEIRFSGEIRLGVPLPGFPPRLAFVHQASLTDFRFDQGDAPATLGEYLVVVDHGADDADSAAWEARRAEPLTALERAAYSRIDSLEQAPGSVGDVLLSAGLRGVALATDPDFFHFNRVEGAYIGAGATVRDLSPDLVLRVKTGYATEREDWQHEFGARYRLSERQRLWMGASYRDEVVQRPALISGASNSTYPALFGKSDPLDYYHEEGFSASLSLKLLDFTQLRLQYNDYDQQTTAIATAFSLFNKDGVLRLNPPALAGRLRSVSGTFNYDSRPLLKRKGRDYFLNQWTYTQVTIGGEYASPGFVANDFDFSRFYIHVRRRQRTLNMGLTTITLFAGSSSGQLPPQRYYTVDYARNVVFQPNGFNTVEENNFVGNRAAMIVVNHDFDQQLLRRSRIPLLRALPFTISVHGGVFWTDIVDQNPNPGDGDALTAPTAYSEIGFGIANLTPWLSPLNFGVWFTWQLSSYDTDPFALRIGIPGF